MKEPQRFRRASLFRLVLCVSVSAGAFLLASEAHPSPQQVPNNQSQTSLPILQTTTRLVKMNVVVRDRKGEPVTDLTVDDFEVADDGHAQKIRSFSHETNQPPPANPALETRPDTYTNQFLERGSTPHSVTVLLLDGLNTEAYDQVYARSQVIKFLKRIQPQDRFAIYTLGHDLRVLQDFTGDSSSLVAAVSKYSGQTTLDLDASDGSTPTEMKTGSDTADAILQDAFQQVANYYIQDRVNLTTAALIDIANHLSAVPGRKNLLWVSGSFPFSVRFESLQDIPNIVNSQLAEQLQPSQRLLFADDVEKAARALDDADVAVYPVDARGLLGMNMTTQQGSSKSVGYGAFNAVASRTSNGSTVNSVSGKASQAATGRRALNTPNAASKKTPTYPIQDPDAATDETMTELAERTGGRTFYNTNDILASLHDAIDDSRFTYEIGYYPADVKWDGGFHHVVVRVRRPGVSVRTREGYFAQLNAPVKPDTLRDIVARAILSPLEATDVALAVRMTPVTREDPRSATAMVFFDPRSIYFERKDGHLTGVVGLVFAQLDDKHQVIDTLQKSFSLNLSPEQFAEFNRQQTELTQTVTAAPNATSLRVVVCDSSTGAVGSVTIPLDR